MTSVTPMKQYIIVLLDSIPEDQLPHVARVIESLRAMTTPEATDAPDDLRQTVNEQPPFHPVALGGLWQGIEITDEDIAEVRREMWATLGAGDL